MANAGDITAWREAAIAWVGEHVVPTGEVEQFRLRPWATVLRVPTADGPVWMKAAARSTAFEVPLYRLLARIVPERVLTPIAVDVERSWLLLPDGGPSLGERGAGIEPLVAALVAYGRMQRTLEPAVEEMIALGVPDMRPAVMVDRFHEALTAAGGNAEVEAMEPTVVEWCERLAASPLPPSLDHNDLHPWNILAGGRYYDWGDSVVAHPFAAMLVPLGFVGFDDPSFARARDAYLDVFADLAPHAELVETLALACRVAKIARALTWDRALRAAREQGEPADPRWENAAAETLAALLDESYLLR
jgi:Phosphotransferase enzyme family